MTDRERIELPAADSEPSLSRSPSLVLPTREHLQGPVAELVADFALSRAFPVPPQFPSYRAGTIGGRRFPELRGQLEQRGAELRLQLNGDGFTGGALEEVMNEPVVIELDDGSTVEARLGCYATTRVSVTARSAPERTSVVLMDDWIHRSTAQTVCWTGRLDGARIGLGNTWGSRAGSSTRQILRLKGNYVWYLLGEPRAVVALIDVGPGTPDAALLNADFMALQLAQGRPLRLDALLGLDVNGTVVARTGVGLGARGFEQTTSLGPITPDGGAGLWSPVLFPAAARRFSSESSRALRLLATAFLDSTVDYLDSGYLKLQVGLEAFLGAMAEKAPRRLLVQDMRRWTEWVDRHAAEIRGYAVDDASADRLLNKIRTNAPQQPSSDVVTSGLAHVDVSFPSELVDETRQRNQVVHRFWMRGHGQVDLEEDLQRVRRLQTLAIGLMAWDAGYRGPIVDWTKLDQGRVPPAEWWRTTEPAESSTRYFRCGDRAAGAA